MKRRFALFLTLLFALFLTGIGVSSYLLLRTSAELSVVLNLHKIGDLRQELELRLRRAQSDLQVSETVFAKNLDGTVADVVALEKAVAGCHECHHESPVEEQLGRLDQLAERYKDQFSVFITFAGDPEAREALQIAASQTGDEIGAVSAALESIAEPELRKRTETALARIDRTRWILAATLVGTLLATILAALLLLRRFSGPIEKLALATEQIAQGEVGTQVEHSERYELGRLMDSFNNMSASLKAQKETIDSHVGSLHRLNSAVLSLHTTLDRDVATSRLQRSVATLLGAEWHGTVLPADSASGFRMRLARQDGAGETRRCDVEEEALRQIHRDSGGEALVVKRASSSDWPFSIWDDKTELRNFLVSWLVVKGKLAGALLVVNREGQRILEEDVNLLNILANGASEALENIGLYQNLERQMEELRDARYQLAEAEKMTALGALSSGIAHDFNNMLCAILGHAQMLKSAGSGGLKDRSIEAIEEASRRAAELTRRLMTFSHPERMEKKQVEVNRSVSEVAGLLTPTFDKRITWDIDLAEPSPVIDGDPRQVEQVLMNLCINARDAMPEGGQLRIKTELVELDAGFCARHRLERPGTYAHLLVADTGKGISDEALSRIFDPFFTTKEAKTATGLGLSVVYGIVQSHGGTCLVQTEPGQGTRFDIYLRAATAPAPVIANLVRPDQPEERNLLVVDDEEMIRAFLLSLLTSLGYQARAVTNGLEAVQAVTEAPDTFDLILLDLNMPEKSGEEALREIKQIRPNLKVLVTSGGGLSDGAMELVWQEADGFLPKPFTFEEVSAKVVELLSV